MVQAIIFCGLLFPLVAQISGQMGLIGDALEAFGPCDDSVLTMSRLIGGPPRLENYWDGTVNLDKWPTLSEIRIGLTVDNPARIELDEDDGRVLVRNRTFHIRAYGSQPEVNSVKFKIRGEPKGAFPNVERLTLNDEDVCRNPKKWKPTILGYLNNVGETEKEQQEVPKCGKRIVEHQELITSGFPSKEGDWPWHAAIYHQIDTEQKYKCGGTLINSNTVLTGESRIRSHSTVIIIYYK